ESGGLVFARVGGSRLGREGSQQPRAEPLVTGRADWWTAGLAPRQVQPCRRIRVDLPSKLDAPFVVGEGTVLDRVGYELMQCQRHRQRIARRQQRVVARQRDALRSL